MEDHKPHELDAEIIAFAQRIFQYSRAGFAQELAEMLEQGLPPNLRNDKGDSLLMLACYHGHHDAAQVLLDHGGDPELVNDSGQTPLAGAAFRGNPAIVRLLLQYGADVNHCGPDGRTPLIIAAMFNRTGIVDILLEHGADMTAREATGLTAEAAARLMGAIDTADQLAQAALSKGALS